MTTGYYSPTGDTKEYRCPAGYSCVTNTPVACATGQYSDDGVNQCNDCPIGFACPDPKNSQAIIDCSKLEGFYAIAIKQTKCLICPAGSYCTAISNTPTACDDGQYAVEG